MIRVAVNGACGRMGSLVCQTVDAAEDMDLVARIDVKEEEGIFNDLALAIESTHPDCVVDFTHPSCVAGNIRVVLSHGVDCVVGTTGLSDDVLQRIYDENALQGTTLFVAPNFTTGAVLMMQMAKMAARYFPDAEVIEFHHDQKADSPSGTAMRTAQLIQEARGFDSAAPGKETEIPGAQGARGALIDGVPVHSVRTDGYVAHQEVIFGSKGQTLTIRHDSHDRASYMPGVMLAVRSVGQRSGLIIGLENLMD